MNVSAKGVLYGGAALVAGVLAWRLMSSARALSNGVANTWPTVNPSSPDNIIYKSAGAVVQAATGGAALSVGDALYQAKDALLGLFGIQSAGEVATQPSPFVRPSGSWTAADQEDADQGGAFRAGQLGMTWYGQGEQDDAEMGLAMTAMAGRPSLDYSYLARPYRRAK